MTDERPGRPFLPLETAKAHAERTQYEAAQAWALIAIADELRAIRQEQHRQARSSRG